MWWFVLTFILGIVVVRMRILPSWLRKKPQRVVFPSLIVLLWLLGAQIGGRPEIWRALPSLGWKAIVITIFSMAGSAVAVLLTGLVSSRWNGRQRPQARGREEHS